MKPKSRNLFFAATALFAVCSADATTLYWDVNGTTDGFSTVVGGWNGTNAFWNTDSTGGNAGAVQAGTTSGDDLIISQATTNTGSITVTGAQLASSITFAPNVGPTTNITGGTSITIGGSGASSGIFQQSSGANTVSTALILNSANSAFAINSTGAGTLTVSGSMTGSASIGDTQTINVTSVGGTITLANSVISDGLSGGKVAVVYGAGTTALSTNNTYSGGFTLNSGIINGIGAGTYGGFGTGLVTINGGRITFNSGVNATIANNMNWNADFAVDRGASSTPTINWNGNITLGANVTSLGGPAAGSGYNQIFNGNILDDITGGRSLSFTTSGTGGRQFITLNGNNTFTGNLSITRGSLTIGGSGKLGGGDYSGNISITSTATSPITYSSSSDQILRGVIGGVAGLGLTKDTSSASTLTLTNTSTYTGATTVAAGRLSIASTGNINTTSGVTIGTAATAATSEFNYNSSTALTKAVSFAADSTGGTLSGSGSTINLAVNVTTGNTLAVGANANTVGVMNFANTLGLAGTAIMEIDGNLGAGVTGGHDFVNLTGVGAAGVLTYGGLMTLDIGTIFGEGVYTWDLFDMASETSTFGTISLADQYSGNLLDGDADGIWDLTSGLNTWQFTESSGVLSLNVAAVPEPDVAALLGALGMLVLLRRRR